MFHVVLTVIALLFGATAQAQIQSTCPMSALPAPTGSIVTVSTAIELAAAVKQANQQGGQLTILIEDGTYLLDNMLFVTTDYVTLRSVSGNREAVVLKGKGMTGAVPHIFLVKGKHFTVADLTLGWVKNHGIQIQGELDADYPLIHNVHFVDTGEQMLKVSFTPGNATSSDNGILEWSLFEYSAGVGPQYYIGGIDAHQAHRWTVRNNTFMDIRSPESALAEHAIHFWSDSEDTVVEKNIIINCDRGIGFGLGDEGQDGQIIRNNMIHTTRDVGIGLESSINVMVYNNTLFTENYPNSIEYRFEASYNNQIVNNLSNAGIVSRSGGMAVVENNVTDAQAAWFVTPHNGDLHLAASQPSVVNQARTLAKVTNDIDCDSRPQGNAPDIGADEIRVTSPTPIPTSTPTVKPTVMPTAVPTSTPTVKPTVMPTAMPTSTPTVKPTVMPTAVPTSTPTVKPTVMPTAVPTSTPTVKPTVMPTALPTSTPTVKPTVMPTAIPTSTPTVKPTVMPTAIPTSTPTAWPTPFPTIIPDITPTPGVTPVPEPTTMLLLGGGLLAGLLFFRKRRS